MGRVRGTEGCRRVTAAVRLTLVSLLRLPAVEPPPSTGYCWPGTHFIVSSAPGSGYIHTHFTDMKTEARRGPRPHSTPCSSPGQCWPNFHLHTIKASRGAQNPRQEGPV